jgi:3-dehydroquinate synthase
MGMVLAAETGERLGLTAKGSAAGLRGLLALYGLDTDCPYAPAELSAIMGLDKKNSAGAVRLIVLKALGDAFAHSFDRDAFGRALCADGTP